MNCRWSNGHEFFLFALQLFKFPLTHKPAVDWPVALIHRVTSTSCGCRETDPRGSADFLRTACKPPRPLGLAGTHQRLNTETRNDAKERNKYKRANRELDAEAAPPSPSSRSLQSSHSGFAPPSDKWMLKSCLNGLLTCCRVGNRRHFQWQSPTVQFSLSLQYWRETWFFPLTPV